MGRRAMHNVTVKAVSAGASPGFDVVLLFSGLPETVVHRAHDGLLYQVICGGMRLDDLRRWDVRSKWGVSAKVSRRASRKQQRAVARLLADIDKYLEARSAVRSSFDLVSPRMA